MFENLSLLNIASAMARHAAARHRVIAENVANADTPGYRARDTKDFQASLNEAFTPRRTRPGHLPAAARAPVFETFELEAPRKPNGNSVSVEDQMRRAAENQGRHALALAVYAKSVAILRLGLGRLR